MKCYIKTSKLNTKLLFFVISLVFIVFSCTDDPKDGVDGNDGINGLNSLITTTIESSGSNCENGGILIQTGLDTNQDGTLDSTEVTSTSYICNGKEEYQTLVGVIEEAPGINCANGGQVIRTGVDTNKNEILDTDEIDNSVYVCNGADGITSLINSTEEEAGENCTNGGIKIEFGLDNNANGILDEAEITSTSYVCNGTVESQDQVIINNLITDEIQGTLDEFNIVLPEGTNPPNLEGAYFCNSLVLENSNISSDTVGMSFNDLTFQIKEQNKKDLTVTILTQEGNSTQGSGTGGFIVGSDNKFAVFLEQLSEDTSTNGKALSIRIYLGELRDDEIINFELILVMKDDFGDPTNQYIDEGKGRHIIEQDGISPKVDVDLSSKSTTTTNTTVVKLNNFIDSFFFQSKM